MSDDTEALPEVECELEPDRADDSDWHEFSGAGSSQSGMLIFPGGVEAFANEVGAIAIRIASKGGDIEILTELGKPWRQVDKPSGGVSAITAAHPTRRERQESEQ